MAREKGIERFRQPIAAAANMISEPTGSWCLYEDHLDALGEAEGELLSLRSELATLLGPRPDRKGATRNEVWIAAVAEVLGRAEAAEGALAGLREDVERLKANALESQGAIQPVIGALRMGNRLGDELDRLERCHDFIKRNVDGEDWEAAWAALQEDSKKPELSAEEGS